MRTAQFSISKSNLMQLLNLSLELDFMGDDYKIQIVDVQNNKDSLLLKVQSKFNSKIPDNQSFPYCNLITKKQESYLEPLE